MFMKLGRKTNGKWREIDDKTAEKIKNMSRPTMVAELTSYDALNCTCLQSVIWIRLSTSCRLNVETVSVESVYRYKLLKKKSRYL